MLHICCVSLPLWYCKRHYPAVEYSHVKGVVRTKLQGFFFQSFVLMRLQFSFISNQTVGAESKRRYVNPMFQPSMACPSLAAIYCMWPNRCFVMEGEDTCKSHKGYLCLCKNAFVHTLTINMPDFTCSVLVLSCDTCTPDKICWAQNKSRIRS